MQKGATNRTIFFRARGAPCFTRDRGHSRAVMETAWEDHRSIVSLVLVVALLACGTSFIKFSIVFGILRKALGIEQVVTSFVFTVLAVLLSLLVMNPVMRDAGWSLASLWAGVASASNRGSGRGLSKESAPLVDETSKDAMFDAWLAFLERNAGATEKAAVAAWVARSNAKAPTSHGHDPVPETSGPRNVSEEALQTTVTDEASADASSASSKAPAQPPSKATSDMPSSTSSAATSAHAQKLDRWWQAFASFLLTELSEALLIGFLLLLPFLIIDLGTSTLIGALGLQGMSPGTIALPIKLVLFVMVGGWALLSESLVLSYQ